MVLLSASNLRFSMVGWKPGIVITIYSLFRLTGYTIHARCFEKSGENLILIKVKGNRLVFLFYLLHLKIFIYRLELLSLFENIREKLDWFHTFPSIWIGKSFLISAAFKCFLFVFHCCCCCWFLFVFFVCLFECFKKKKKTNIFI